MLIVKIIMVIIKPHHILLIMILIGYVAILPITSLYGQNNDNTDNRVETLASSITENLPDDQEKAFAIYAWVAQNIEYDFLGVENVTMGFESSQVVEEALTKGKGVCQHYAELFHALAEESGLTSIVVFGYTRQNGKIDKVPHAWSALMIDSSWYLFDPTWGAGYFDGTNYQHQFREKYFKVKPAEMIKSHMPFDPLFQFLEKPVTHENFKKGKFQPGDLSIDYKKEIIRFRSLDRENQIAESMVRVKDFGIANTMVRGYYSNLNRQHQVYIANRQVDLHNEAIDKFNKVVADYNNYAQEMNALGGRFPNNSSNIEAKLNQLESDAVEVQALFNQVDAPARLALTLAENQENLEMLLKQIRKEQIRLQKSRL
jgi:hypothetical protein